jgi:hypothetical protein
MHEMLYSIIPPFHYSWLEYAEWLAGNSLLSTICRISAAYIKGGQGDGSTTVKTNYVCG